MERKEQQEVKPREDVEGDEDCRKPFLQLFILIFCLGCGFWTLLQACFESYWSGSAIVSFSLSFTTALWLFISIRNGDTVQASSSQDPPRRSDTSLMVALYAFCGIFNVGMSVRVLTDTPDVYAWFLCIPFLVLYAHGVRSCVIALVLVMVQTTLLRYMRQWFDLIDALPPSSLRRTTFADAYFDCLLFVLLTTLAACHHHARAQALARLGSVLREMDATNRELRRATQAKSEFLANMSHELRTPMHGIIAMTQELQESFPATSPKAKHAIAIISDCAEHLLSLVSDILDFERIECNQLQLEAIPFSIAEETQKALHLLQTSADKKHLAVSLETSIPHPLHVGDPLRHVTIPDMYRQVLVNVLSNAIKFTPDHGSVWITVRNDGDPEVVTVAVKDTGIGIKEDHLKLLFSPFAQVDTSICRKFGGSGLGLAISRRLCSAMGGSIECESQPGKGSTFTCRFILPAVTSSPPGPGGDDKSALKAADGEAEPNQRFDGLKVLLVEDNIINQKVGKRMLSTLGCTVTVADNGEECLKLLTAAPDKKEGRAFDIVLMDCQMPVMDGFEATQRIRNMESQPSEGEESIADGNRGPLAVVALTASATKEYAKRCVEVGMSDVLFKPLRREDLAAALHKWTALAEHPQRAPHSNQLL